MTMVSYAQNHEDVLLNRVFEGKRSGHYVDVGAGDPTNGSVTRHFYDLGWSGINIEPGRQSFERLVRERPRDVNLRVALSSEAGKATFFEVLHSAVSDAEPTPTGLSSLSSAFLEGFRKAGLEIRQEEVETRTLAQVMEQHALGEVDFLKIDVEGWERHVLQGCDWASFRPRILVIEAVDPVLLRESLSPESRRGAGQEGSSSCGPWEPIVLGAGYTFAYFDGLNRFYVRGEEPELVARLKVQANPLDDFVRYTAGVEAFERELARVRRDWKAERSARLRLRRRVLELEEQFRILQTSRSWRITRPIRRAKELLDQLRDESGA